jgi:hypothetical protein
MDFDPTTGTPGAAGPTRTATSLALDARRGVTPPEVEREAVSRTAERATYTSPGLRPAGDATRDVVVQLSQKALALAKSAREPPPRAKSVDDDGDDEHARVHRRSSDEGNDGETPRRHIDTRA